MTAHSWCAARREAILGSAARASRLVLSRYRDAPRIVAPQQWVIADIWHDHVLFQDDEVSGLVDFGAVRTDAVSLDLARLLGSLIEDEPRRWSEALDAYQQDRPLSPGERGADPRPGPLRRCAQWNELAAMVDRRAGGSSKTCRELPGGCTPSSGD